jgi:hypothetical protein
LGSRFSFYDVIRNVGKWAEVISNPMVKGKNWDVLPLLPEPPQRGRGKRVETT